MSAAQEANGARRRLHSQWDSEAPTKDLGTYSQSGSSGYPSRSGEELRRELRRRSPGQVTDHPELPGGQGYTGSACGMGPVPPGP